jgi:hypothetical protein
MKNPYLQPAVKRLASSIEMAAEYDVSPDGEVRVCNWLDVADFALEWIHEQSVGAESESGDLHEALNQAVIEIVNDMMRGKTDTDGISWDHVEKIIAVFSKHPAVASSLFRPMIDHIRSGK